MTQRDLVDAAMRGDHEAFEELTLAVSGRLYAIARLTLRDVDLAEDALQEALVKMWRSLPSLRDPGRFDAWAYRLIVNACADAGRQQRRRTGEVRLIHLDPGSTDAMAVAADRDELERGFRQLRPDHRAALVLHYFVGLPAHEVAGILGIPVGTAKSRIHYAVDILRAVLDADARTSQGRDERSA